MKPLRDILTGRDGTSHDIGRWSAVASILVGLGLEVFAVVCRGQPFDMLAFGGGIGALAAGIGALLKLKEGTEP